MVKTISLTALPGRFVEFLRDMEGRLRVDVARLEEESRFEGHEGRYVIALAAAEEHAAGADADAGD